MDLSSGESSESTYDPDDFHPLTSLPPLIEPDYDPEEFRPLTVPPPLIEPSYNPEEFRPGWPVIGMPPVTEPQPDDEEEDDEEEGDEEDDEDEDNEDEDEEDEDGEEDDDEEEDDEDEEGANSPLHNIQDPSTATLTDDQIRYLIYKPRAVRKTYRRYYGTTGYAKKLIHYILFERTGDENLRHPERVLKSNVRRWQDALNYYENPNTFRQRGGIRYRAKKITKPKRGEDGHFLPMPLHEARYLDDTARNILTMEALSGRNVIPGPSDHVPEAAPAPGTLAEAQERLVIERGRAAYAQQILQREVQTLRRINADAMERINELEEEAATLTRRCTDLQTENDELGGDVIALRVQNEDLRAQLSSQQTMGPQSASQVTVTQPPQPSPHWAWNQGESFARGDETTDEEDGGGTSISNSRWSNDW